MARDAPGRRSLTIFEIADCKRAAQRPKVTRPPDASVPAHRCGAQHDDDDRQSPIGLMMTDRQSHLRLLTDRALPRPSSLLHPRTRQSAAPPSPAMAPLSLATCGGSRLLARRALSSTGSIGPQRPQGHRNARRAARRARGRAVSAVILPGTPAFENPCRPCPSHGLASV